MPTVAGALAAHVGRGRGVGGTIGSTTELVETTAASTVPVLHVNSELPSHDGQAQQDVWNHSPRPRYLHPILTPTVTPVCQCESLILSLAARLAVEHAHGDQGRLLRDAHVAAQRDAADRRAVAIAVARGGGAVDDVRPVHRGRQTHENVLRGGGLLAHTLRVRHNFLQATEPVKATSLQGTESTVRLEEFGANYSKHESSMRARRLL